jgi:hypothetical protein
MSAIRRRHRLVVLVAGLVAGVAPSSALAQSAPVGNVLTIHMVPAVKGVNVRLDGTTYVSGADGDVRVPVERRTNLTQRLQVEPSPIGAGKLATFAGWRGDLSRSTLDEVVATLDVSYRVDLSFVDLESDPVDLSRVSRLKLRSSHGIIHELTRKDLARPVWLQGTRVVSRLGGLAAKDVYYTVDAAIVEGSNVVNRAQQRFFPRTERSIPVELLLFTARISAHDALLKFSTGSAVRLKHPDGTWDRYPLGSDGELVLADLPRGDYWVEVDAPGMSFVRPVSLSRNQDVRLEVLSYLDIGLVALLFAQVILGLLFIGRPHLLDRLFTRRRADFGRLARETTR